MTDYHEPPNELSAHARDLHRALISLREEIEAVDWYNQRVECCADEELRRVLAHNRDEEIEHACMTLEWLRRRMPKWDENLRKFLFKEGPIEKEGEEDEGPTPPPAGRGLGLGVGGLKSKESL